MTLAISELTSTESIIELNPYQSRQLFGGVSALSFHFNFAFSWSKTDITSTSQTGNAIGPNSLSIQATGDVNINTPQG